MNRCYPGGPTFGRRLSAMLKEGSRTIVNGGPSAVRESTVVVTMESPAAGMCALREKLSKAIRRVRAAKTLEFREDDHAVTCVAPVVAPAESLEQPVAEGVLLPPLSPGPLLPPLDLPSHMTGEEATDHLRGR
jgi:hypothetical protein